MFCWDASISARVEAKIAPDNSGERFVSIGREADGSVLRAAVEEAVAGYVAEALEDDFVAGRVDSTSRAICGAIVSCSQNLTDIV